MGSFLFYLFLFTNILLSVKYQYSTVDCLLLIASTIFSYVFLKKMTSIKDNALVLFVIIYVYLAIQIVALFELSSVGFFKDVIYPKEYMSLAIWGNRLFFTEFTVLFLFSFFKKKHNNTKHVIRERHGGSLDSLYISFTIFIYFLSFISLVLGISSLMGDAKVILPFHLNGLIDEVRSNVYPFVFAIYIFDCLDKQRKIKKEMILLFIIYVALEVIIRASKGAFLFSFMPVMELLIFMGFYSRKVIVKYMVPLLMIFLFIYPIIETARLEGEISANSLQYAYKTNRSNTGEEGSSPFIRAFLTGVYYTKLVDIVSDDHLSFDLRRVPLLVSMDNGGITYMTEVIDGVPPGSNQSSGVTGLCDALLWGGYPLGYIVLVLIILLSLWGDQKYYMRETPLYRVILFYILYRLVLGRSISFLSDTFIIAVLAISAIKLIITKFYYSRYY